MGYQLQEAWEEVRDSNKSSVYNLGIQIVQSSSF